MEPLQTLVVPWKPEVCWIIYSLGRDLAGGAIGISWFFRCVKLNTSSFPLLWIQMRLYLHWNRNHKGSWLLPPSTCCNCRISTHLPESISVYILPRQLHQGPCPTFLLPVSSWERSHQAQHLSHLRVSASQRRGFSVGSGTEGRRASSSASAQDFSDHGCFWAWVCTWFRYYSFWANPQGGGESGTWILASFSPPSPSRCSCKITPFTSCTQHRCLCANGQEEWGSGVVSMSQELSVSDLTGHLAALPHSILGVLQCGSPHLFLTLQFVVDQEAILTLPSWEHNPSLLKGFWDNLLQTSVHKAQLFLSLYINSVKGAQPGRALLDLGLR